MTEISDERMDVILCDIEQVKSLIKEASTGLKYDPSWIRPVRLIQADREDRGKQASLLLDEIAKKLEGQ